MFLPHCSGRAPPGSAIALLATSAWLISRAAQHPSVVALGVAIVGVQFFSMSRALFRYKERLVGHDAALRVLADIRASVYEHLERSGAHGPAGFPQRRPFGPPGRGRGCLERPDASRWSLRSGWPCSSASRRSGLSGTSSRPPAVVLAHRLVLGAVLVPWYALGLARRREDRQAAARGELSTHVVDLLEGAPELVAFGATDAQLARVAAADAELTRIATASSRTAGVGVGPRHPAHRTGRLGHTARRACRRCTRGGCQGPLLAVVALAPLAAFEMVIGLPAAAQSWHRCTDSAARVFDGHRHGSRVVDPEVPKPRGAPPTSASTGGSAPVRPRAGGGHSTASISTFPRARGSASSARAGPASRPWPRCCCGSCPTRAR